MKIQEAAQNYLETILVIYNRQKHVRAIDVCNELSYSKPTVSIVMKHFRENGYIITDSDGYITLTDKGRIIAETMFERHNVIANILISIGVDRDTAYRDACKIEHDISEKSFECMKNYFMTDKKNL